MTGGVANVWYGAGDGTVHSRPSRAFPDTVCGLLRRSSSERAQTMQANIMIGVRNEAVARRSCDQVDSRRTPTL